MMFPGFLFLLSCLAPALPSEQADTTQFYTLEGVSVTAGRVPLLLGQSARMLTVLDRVAIVSAPAQTVNDLLKYVIGVDVRQRGGMGMQTDIGMRGGTFDQIAVLLNGVSVSDPQTGHNTADFPMDLGEIDRIEILEGPAVRAYGVSSLVGAINVVTKASSRNEASVRLEGGSCGYLNAGGRISAGSRIWRNQFSGSLSRSDGFSRSAAGNLNGDFRSGKLFCQGSLAGKGADLAWHAGMSVKNFGSNTFYSPKYDNQFEHTFKTFAAVQAQTRGWLHFKPVLYWNGFRDRFELFRGDPSKVAFNHHRTQILGVNATGWFATALGKTAWGTELRNEQLLSTNLGEPLRHPVNVRGYDARYVTGLGRTHLNLFLEHNVILRRLTFSAGVSAVRNTGNREGFRLYPGIDAGYWLSERMKIYGSYHSSLRPPSFTELYYSVGGHRADKNLKAEKMQSMEAGAKLLYHGIRITGCVYHHRGSDLIDWIKDMSQGDDAPWTSVNHTRLNTLGEELSIRLDIPELTRRESCPVRYVSLGYAHTAQNKVAESGIQSRYALEYLRHKFVAQLHAVFWSRLSLNVSWRYLDRVGSYEAFRSGTGSGTLVPFDPYSLLDARLNWDAPVWSVFLEANNLLDRTYFDHGNVPQPGMWFRAGVRCTVGL